MAATPFTSTVVAYPGAATPKDRNYSPLPERQFWLGRPGNMIQLPAATPEYQIVTSRGEVVHTLPGGGQTLTVFAREKRSWALQWVLLQGRDWQVIHGFHLRLFGAGPWCFPDPADVNHLPIGTSLCGALNGVAEGWTPTVGTVVYDATVAAALSPCGVLRWAGAGNGSLLVAGTVTGVTPVPDVTAGAPYIGALANPVQIQVKAATSNVSVQVIASGRQADGTLTAEVTGPAVTVTSAGWTTLTVTGAALALGTPAYVVLVLKCLTAAAGNLLVCCPQLEYGPSPSDWAAGAGVPRVILPAGFTLPVSGLGTRDVSMSLAEI